MHIVIISHYYPPLNAIASFRPASFAKYFAENGMYVTILTTEKDTNDGGLDLGVFSHPLINIVATRYKRIQFWRKAAQADPALPVGVRKNTPPSSSVKKILTKMRKWGVAGLGSFIDYQFFWTSEALARFKKIHEQQPVDVIISSFGPVCVHRIATKIKSKYSDIKWIADYRDLWSLNHISAAAGMINVIERVYEKNIVKHADHLTTVSNPLADELRKFFNGNIPVDVIYNGYTGVYMPQKLTSNGKRDKRPLRLVYTGTIYKGRRDPSPLLLALNELESEGLIQDGDVEVVFYGKEIANLNQIIAECNAYGWVKIRGYVSHDESIKAQSECDILLFLESNDPVARGVLTGKIFEYIISGKPILGLGIDEYCATGQLLNETSTGFVVSNDIKKIRKVIMDYIGNGAPVLNPDKEKIKQFSRNHQAEKMLSIAQTLHESTQR